MVIKFVSTLYVNNGFPLIRFGQLIVLSLPTYIPVAYYYPIHIKLNKNTEYLVNSDLESKSLADGLLAEKIHTVYTPRT